jgi:gas vesicle protein
VALDSISKLSVLITGDESPLAASTRRAEGLVGGMARRMDAASASTVKLSTAMAAMRGNIPAIFQASGLSGASVGPVAAMVAMVAGMYKLGAASDALNVSLQRNELDTWTGQWKRLKNELAITNSLTAGGTFNSFFRDASKDIADYVRSWNEWLNPQKTAEIAARAKWLAETEQRERGAAAAAKLHAKAQADKAQALKDAAQAAEAERSARGDTLRRAEEIRAMVRTPAEEFQRSVNELRAFFVMGFIDQVTMDRAMKMAQERANDASRPRDRAMNQAQQSVAAAERYSMAGYSAGLPQRQDNKQEEKQLVNLNQGILDVMKHIDAVLQTRPDTQMVRLSNLN